MEFTGERYIPSLDSPEISYEHWHRYLYATRFSAGRTVLDIACGDGYGSYLLSLNARMVMGMDISQDTINHAASTYIRDNLEFKVGSARSIPIEGREIFDVIVSFETIEHIGDDEQKAFMAEVKRLLKKDGLFIVSTPNKLLYTDLPGYQNQFHVREFYVHEFEDLLRQNFPHVSLLGQKIYPVSYIWSPGTDERRVREYRLECTESGFRPTDGEKKILYVIGLCSAKPLDVEASVLVDLDERILSLKAQQIGELENALRRKEARVANLEAGVSARDARIGDLEAGVRARDARIKDLERAHREGEAYIQQIHSGHGWRLLTRYFKLRERLFPLGTKRSVLAKSIFHIILSAAQALGRITRTNFRKLVYLKDSQSIVPPPIFGNPPGRADSLFLPERARRLLVVDHRVPAPDQDAGSVRMSAILKLLREMDYAVTFVSNSECRMLEYEGQLRQLGIPVLYGYSAAVAHLTQHGHQYEFVLLSRPEVAFRFLPAVRAYALNSTVIYDTVDLHWVRMRRAAELSGDSALRDLADRFKRMERLNAVCADLVLAVTPEEKEGLLAEAPDARVEVVPTIHTSRPPSDLGSQREGLMFIGGFAHDPNIDAVKWFVGEVFPLIQRQLAGIVVYVIGSKMPEQVTVLASPTVRIVGYLPDPERYFRAARVFVAPIRYGAGMKGKIGQSMSYGLPVVTTSVGAEGMMLQDGENVLIADDPEAFARAVVRLYTDDPLWRKIANNSLKHIREYFSEEVVKASLGTILAGVQRGDRARASGQERTECARTRR